MQDLQPVYTSVVLDRFSEPLILMERFCKCLHYATKQFRTRPRKVSHDTNTPLLHVVVLLLISLGIFCCCSISVGIPEASQCAQKGVIDATIDSCIDSSNDCLSVAPRFAHPGEVGR